MVAKVAADRISHEWGNVYSLNFYGRESLEGRLCDGRFTISVKQGKRRILIPGKLRVIAESCAYTGLSWSYLFCPNNPSKLQTIAGG
jgi:hypothetical protein